MSPGDTLTTFTPSSESSSDISPSSFSSVKDGSSFPSVDCVELLSPLVLIIPKSLLLAVIAALSISSLELFTTLWTTLSEDALLLEKTLIRKLSLDDILVLFKFDDKFNSPISSVAAKVPDDPGSVSTV
ncbi:Glucokinase [Frankliniella fusca]|uniref:Glucokinase n=1 Tax=Frankliniella fusca TaxID=407009 RepID=A0AAE1LC19_9NEOP|nr:Glucokinase [Frankliniella fusca]